MSVGRLFKRGLPGEDEQPQMPPDAAVMDNAPAREPVAEGGAAWAAGTELRFPPLYGPDFDRIKIAVARLKSFLTETEPRTKDGP